MSDDSLSIDALREATIHGLRWAVLSRPIVECIGMGSTLVLARLVAPEAFGRYSIALIVFALGSITGQGVGAALVQRRTITREHLRAGLTLALVTGLALVGLVLLAAHFVVTPVYGRQTADLVRLIAPLCFLSAAAILPAAMLQRQLAFRRLSTTTVVGSAVTAITSIALAVAGLNGAALVLGQVAGQLSITILMWVWAAPPPPTLRPGPARDLLGYGGPASLAALAWTGFANCDYAIIGARLGPLAAGLYYRSYTVAVDYQKKVSSLAGTLGFPLLSRARGAEDQSHLRGRMVGLETVILFPALVLLAILAPVLIPWAFGARWSSTVVPIQILSLGGAATLVIDTVGQALMATGRGRAIMGYGWSHFIGYGTAVWFVSPLGISAVAVAAAVVHGAFVIVAYVLLLREPASGRRAPVRAACRELLRDVRPAAVSCLALAAVAVPLALALSSAHVPALPHLAMVSLAGAAAYLAALRARYPEAFLTLVRVIEHVLPQVGPVPRLTRRLQAVATRSVS